ncbi:MAG: pirin family protein [Pseudomonadota bacterium]
MSKNLVDTVLTPRARDLGDFNVRRVLPDGRHPMVGPFVFFDHMGPAEFPPGHGIDVRPHPHINLATVTYLFEGELFHHDSLDARQNIEPGAVNWMTAGRGIVHSERSSPESRASHMRIHGIQSWIALPKDDEECEPAFWHHPANTLPQWSHDGIQMRLIAGRAFGYESPVYVFSPMFYVDCNAIASGHVTLPSDYTERAAYIASGQVTVDGQSFDEGQMLVFTAGANATLAIAEGSRIMLLGGEPLSEPRHLWWNFVSSRLERIEQAKQDWREGRFDSVPGDDEFIPLPE